MQDVQQIAMPEKCFDHRTSNDLEIEFNLGDFVVIGSDTGDFDFAQVNNVDGDIVHITYCKLSKGSLDTWHKGGKAWQDRCHLNSIFRRVVEEELKMPHEKYMQLLKDITYNIYG